MPFKLVFVLIVTMNILNSSFASERFMLQGEGGVVSSEENGNFYKLEAEFLDFKQFSLGMHYQKESRIFHEEVKVEDSRVGIQGSYKLPKSWYLKWRASLGQDELLFATWSALAEFHWRWKNLNVLVGLRHYDYQDQGLTQEGVAGANYKFGKKFKVGGTIEVANTTPTANVLNFYGLYYYKAFELRGQYRVGGVIEADNVLGDVNSYRFDINYNSKMGKTLYKIGPAFEFYDGTIRDEVRSSINFTGVF